MIKVPATPEGIPVIEELISRGICVYVTLMFAFEVYEQVAEAYLRGLEKRARRGESNKEIASVASIFVSRVDTKIDKLLLGLAGLIPKKRHVEVHQARDTGFNRVS